VNGAGAAEITGADWRQGSLLPVRSGALPLQWVHPENPVVRAGRSAVKVAERNGEPLSAPFMVETPAREGDRMMVITQTCDIIKGAHELPQVEVARVFRTDNASTIAQAQDFGSARYFRVNSHEVPEAWILDYGSRGLLDKGFLCAVDPDNSLVDEWAPEHSERLARWLGRRYSRPAIPDADYEQITRPVREEWRSLVENRPDRAAEYNRVFAEWRYRREEDGSLTLFLLSPEPSPDPLLALEVGDFLTQAIQPAFGGDVRIATDRLSYHSFTKADELTSEQISMEWASFSEEGTGALPVP
jgi:hypothetical protein